MAPRSAAKTETILTAHKPFAALTHPWHTSETAGNHDAHRQTEELSASEGRGDEEDANQLYELLSGPMLSLWESGDHARAQMARAWRAAARKFPPNQKKERLFCIPCPNYPILKKENTLFAPSRPALLSRPHTCTRVKEALAELFQK